MKMLFLVFLIFISLIANSTTYYVAPWGDDDNSGTFEQPWATWGKAITTARAGDTVYFRGGIYYTTSNQACIAPAYGHSGTRTAPICYFNYPGEVPILDGINCTTTTSGLSFQGASNIHLKGLHVRNFLQHESDNDYGSCISFSDGNNITIEQCVAYNAGMRGIYLHGCDTALILNCDAFNCSDSLSTGYEGGGGDGFLVWDSGVAADSINYIVLKGCRSWHNSDDGYDIETEGYIEVDSCWAWDNGYLKGDGDGFKFGFKDHGTVGLSRQLTNCLAVYNKLNGFDENSSAVQCMTSNVFNCTSYRNDQYGFSTCYDCLNPKINTYKNNIAYNDGRSMPKPTGQMTDSYNSWNTPPGVTITDADFISVDSTGISEPRKADGSLPDLNFLKLAGTSDLIDAGMDVGLPYYGPAPDLGWSETNYGKEVLVTGITVTGTGNATSIITDNGTLQLNKAVLPANATNQTVAWSVVDGKGFAAISSTGLVTAIANGIVTAKAMANDGSGIYGTLEIAISNQTILVSNITVTGEGGKTTLLIDEGTLQLHANVVPDSVTDKTVTWSVVNGTGQATINSYGQMTAVAEGTVTVKAAANDGSQVDGTLDITIVKQLIKVEAIEVYASGNVTPVINQKSGTLKMVAEVFPELASVQTVKWSVENHTGNASIDENGIVTALSDGWVKVISAATDGSNVSGDCTVRIINQSPVINLQEKENKEFNVFQSGNKLLINSDFKNIDVDFCSLYTIQGILIHREKVTEETVEIDIAAYPSGAYIIILYTDQKVIPLKIVIP
jgi:parallel beta-helix repeat protein